MYKTLKDYEFFNEFGGFINDGKEYEIVLDGENVPPAPWINVIANKDFGFTVSESGAGYSWAYNSRENKITPWSNDPVSDTCSEVIYIKDEVSGKLTTPVSLGRKDRGLYKARHGFGYTKFFHSDDGIDQELKVFLPMDKSVKVSHVTLTNTTKDERYFTMYYYLEWVLGVGRDPTSPYIVTSYNNEYEYLYAKNVYNYGFRKHRAFIFSSEMIIGYTGDRQQVFGANGSIRNPVGLEKKLKNNTGARLDPCGVIQVSVAVKPGESKEVVFGLGYCDSEDEISETCKAYKNIKFVHDQFDNTVRYWEDILGKIKVQSRDRAMDILLNGWLLYQNISCRLYARTGFYQSGGAYGYRDQLQDSMALIFTAPDMVRNQIIKAARQQFEEGDVQHWWHPPEGLGVRTKITDDLHWLAFVTSFYVRGTGDISILYEKATYIKGPMLEGDIHEMMVMPEISDIQETIYEHCKKAIGRIDFGPHGLPLIGGGDWNDGMNEVGVGGTGESVWLSWFILTMIREFKPMCEIVGDHDYINLLENMEEKIKKNVEEHAWDGEWYMRAFYDDGTKIGSKESDECKIDSISQSWSIISGAGDQERTQRAFQSAWRNLVIEKEGISLLLNPPFDKTEKNPGYIKKYYPGIRENGGQYTHGAIWLAVAATLIGDSNKAFSLFTMLNPIHGTKNRKDALKYEREPYVMTADISYEAPNTGRGGWSWYTGSAAWLYQGLIRYFLGIDKEGEDLIISPAVPESFGDYNVRYKHGSSEYLISFIQAKSSDNSSKDLMITIDGNEVENNRIKLIDDGKTHHVIIR